MPKLGLLKSTVLGAFAAVTLLSVAAPAAAQEWPQGPVKVIVAYPPGGSSDLPARAVVDAVNQMYGTNIIVENLSGAAGLVGLDACAKAAPDGNTFCTFTLSSMCILPHLRELPFDINDFVPVGRIMNLILAYSTPANAPWQSMEEFVAAAKAEPGKLRVGSSGVGTSQHLGEVAFMRAAGIELTHIPMANSAEMITETLAGRLDLIYESTAFAQYDAGNLRILATSIDHPSYPEIPSLASLGYDIAIQGEFSMYAPPGTPDEFVNKFSEMINAVLATPELQARLLQVGGVALQDTPADMRAATSSQCKLVDDLVTDLGIQAQN